MMQWKIANDFVAVFFLSCLFAPQPAFIGTSTLIDSFINSLITPTMKVQQLKIQVVRIVISLASI